MFVGSNSNQESLVQQVAWVMNKPDSLEGKMLAVRNLLKENPQWKQDRAVYDFFVSMNTQNNPALVKFRNLVISKVEHLREELVRSRRPLTQVLAVMEGKGQANLAERIVKLEALLQKHPEWLYKREIYSYLLQKKESGESSKINHIKNKALAPVEGFDAKTGVIFVLEKNLNEQFWEKISKPEVKTLVIQTSSGPVVYEPAFLKKLLEIRPELHELTDQMTVEFSDGTLVLPQAKLRMCGGFFETALGSGMKEMSEGKIVLHEVSLDGFLCVLHAIETEEVDCRFYPDIYKVAANFLQFCPKIEIPECILSPEACWGEGVDEIPTRALLQFLEEVNPENDRKWKDQVIVWWKPRADVNDPLTLQNIESRIQPSTTQESKPRIEIRKELSNKYSGDYSEGGYWVVMIKKPIKINHVEFEYPEQFILNFNKKLGLSQEDGFEVPSTVDVALSCLFHLNCSGEKEPILPKSRKIYETEIEYSICKETSSIWRAVAGKVDSSGTVSVTESGGGGGAWNQAICPIRKFMGSQYEKKPKTWSDSIKVLTKKFSKFLNNL